MAEYKSRHTGAEIDAAVDKINTWFSLPDYWRTHIDAKIPSIRAALESAGWNKSAFLFYSDAHWSTNYKQSPAILKYLHANTPINMVAFGGDVVMSEGDSAEAMAYLYEWRNAVRDLPHHSVPGNHDDGGEVDNRWDDFYIYSYLLAAEETPDVVRGEAGLYYYIDNPAEKTRYLYLDTATKDGNVLNDSAEEAFVKNALIGTPEGWHIVAISHIWLTIDYEVNPPKATGFSMGGQILLDMFDAYNTRQGDYASCGGKVEFCIGGHSHADGDWTTSAGIPVILVECDGSGVRSGLSITKGTITENSVNAVVADYNSSKIHIIRIGRGESRVVNISHTGGAKYTNLLPIATDASGNVYNSIGYKEDVRINSSKQEVTATGWDLSGFIPAKTGDIIRFKNVAFLDMTGANSTQVARVFFYDSNYTQINMSDYYTSTNLMSDAWSPVYGDDGNVVQFTIPNSYGNNVAYIRINADDFNKNSIVTVNEEIV